jgi:fatty-acyl-CoA synthase
MVMEHFPDHEAVVSLPQQRRLTYAGISASVSQLARGLMGSGFRRGDRIGIWSTNNVEWLLLQLATASIGATLVNINPAYRPRELIHALKLSEVSGIFFIPSFRSSDYVAMLVEVIPELREQRPSKFESREFPHLRKVVLYDPRDPAETPQPYPGFSTWTDVLDAADAVPAEEVERAAEMLDRDDPISIQFTSGTTGLPKAVQLTHHNILNNAYFSALAMRFTAQDRLCASVPFYHCFGMVLTNLLCLSVGACVVIPCEHFDPLSVLRAIQAERCTAVHGVPTMFIAELEQPSFQDYDLSSLRTGIMAGAPCPHSLVKRVMEEMHCTEIMIGYGETEASPLTHLTSHDDSLMRRIETVGTNLPHQEAKIVDALTGETLPIDQIGEICFRGYHVMKGYYGDHGATSKAIDERGWLHSGDLGTMDRDGYFRITGRVKDMIIRGGENIYPREIEDFLFTHAKVAMAAVFGVPDDYYGEEIMAWIQLHAGETATDDEIRAFCKGRIAHYKIPRYIWFVNDFPMTVTGKMQKYRMREIALKKMKG